MHEPRNPSPQFPDLSLMQRWFAAVITNPMGVDEGVASPAAQDVAPLSRDELESMVTRSRHCTAQQRMSIYAHAYFARLVDCLGETFAMVRRWIGADAFGGFAFEYLQQHPSSSYTLGELGRHFAPFLRSTRTKRKPTGSGEADWTDLLIDLATLEWSIEEVFDGPGIERMEPFDVGMLTGLAPERWTKARVTLAPCVRLLASQFQVNALYTALRKAGDGAEFATPATQSEWMLITRRAYIVRRITLAQPQHALLTALQSGQTIGSAIESAAAFAQESDEALAAALQEWFAQWARLGLFISIDEADETRFGGED